MSRQTRGAAVRVVVKQPKQKARIVDIAEGFETLRMLVGGNVQALPFSRRDTLMYVDEEGLLRGLPKNILHPVYPPIVGPVVVARVRGSLTTEDAKRIARMLDAWAME